MSRPETRPAIAGPDTPTAPFPLKLRGPVVRGFGRGSKELGIPTANIPLSGLSIGGHDDLDSGIYYGWCALDLSTVTADPSSTSTPSTSTSTSTSTTDATAASERPLEPSSNHAVADLETTPSFTSNNKTIYPTVLSIGYNPFYANTTRSIEIHILHAFPADFYGATLSLVILGYIRPEYDYVSKEALVEDIREDIRVARRSLEREAYEAWKGDGWLVGEGTGDSERGETGERTK